MGNPTDHSSLPLAIIGMSCKLPGAECLDAYWRLILEGGSAVSEVPRDRLEREIYFDPRKNVRGKTYSAKAALLQDKTFDPSRCPLPGELLHKVDRTHLLMTQVAAEAFRHAGYDPFDLPNRNASVFIGHAEGSPLPLDLTFQTYLEDAIDVLFEVPHFSSLPQDHQRDIQRALFRKLRRNAPRAVEEARFLSCNMVAGTVAKAFNLTGSWLALNSACSSSLLAMMMGARALQRGHTDMVLVGGASECKTDTLVLFSNAQTLSADDSRPFDAEADGLVLSEGYAALVMKTLEKALADGDPIQAVVRGLGVASDGRGKSLWAPLKDGQMRAMKRAYRCGLDMSRLQYIEAHATATQLGDATELNSISELLKPALPAGKRIPITSVKANIGHALETAGVAGMIKTVLCLQKRVIPKAINIRQLNTGIDWDHAPFYIPQQVSTWEQPLDGGPRMAGVNAFGIGGLNMHVVVEEYRPESGRLLTQKMRQPESPDDRAVAIIGMGCISPAGCDTRSFFRTLLSGCDPKSEVPQDRWPQAYLRQKASQGERFSGGFIADYQYDWRKHKIPPKQVQQADPLQFMFLDASEQALADAGYTKDTVERELCGVVIGTEFGGEFANELEIGLRLPRIQHELEAILTAKGFSAATTEKISKAYGEAILRKWPALIDESGSFTSSTLASRITKTFDLKGGAVAIDCGATSGLSALAICVDALLCGDNDIMICAAGQRNMGPSAFKDLKASGQLSALQTPFSILDARYDGIKPSEGVAAFVLKRLADARRDADPIRAVIRGIGVGSDQSAAKAIQIAMQKAATQANIHLADVELLNLDTDERACVSETLDSLKRAHIAHQRQHALQLSSSTAQLGHAGGASSLFALMKTSLELQNTQVCGTFNVQQPNPCLTEDSHTIQIAVSSAKFTGQGLGAVASWSKGQALYVLLDDGKPLRPKFTPQRISTVGEQDLPRIIRMGSTSHEQLSRQLAGAAGHALAFWHKAKSVSFQPADRVRLAIVAGDPESLAQKIHLAQTQLKHSHAQRVLMQQGIFCRDMPHIPPRVAFLFPGQGSQYEGMLRELVRQSPGASRAASDADQAMQQLGYPTFAELAWTSPSQLGKDIWATQISMLLADKICLNALQEQGVLPDLVLGHSYGEFAALLAAGVWDLETAIRMTKARCEGIETVSLKNAGLLATNAPSNDIKSLIQRSGLRLYFASFNAPDQTVVGGKIEELKQFAQALVGRSFTAQLLPVPAAFHTPLMAGSSRRLVQALQTIDLRVPEIPLISTVNNQVVEDPAQARTNLGVQLTTPLHYAALIERLASETPTVFVEVGPQQTLTRLNRRILSNSTTAIACDNPKSSGLAQVLCVKALLECLGERRQASAPAVPLPTESSRTTPVMKNSSSSVDLSPDKEYSPMDDILYFDATARRREKMRMASKIQPRKANGNGQVEDACKTAASKLDPPPASKASAFRPAVPSPVHGPTDVQPVKAQEPIANTMTGKVELERFLINFVVEQTGYPPEVVELDADLEADLGIDSIKKAQLFGELQEYFEIDTAATDISLDDFPTLRHVTNFLARHGQATSTPTPPKAATELVELPVERGPDPAATTASGPEPARPVSTSPEELKGFLINFVVEQTGYPPEVVELDADLEADLGIDSIKKAQLFGELQEYFEIDTAATNISLDDFPTLRHVMNFLVDHGRATSSLTTSKAATELVELPAERDSNPVAATAFGPEPARPASTNPEELEGFLINFVVEQTGYPPEVVELDADLEADLGIDSIKKAQLFGELQEYFEINTSATDISLDDFPTLRHVMNFLADNGQALLKEEPPPDIGETSFSSAAPAPARELNKARPAPVAVGHTTRLDETANSNPNKVTAQVRSAVDSAARDENELGGTAYELGWQHGLRFRSEIQETLHTYVDCIGHSLDELPGSEYNSLRAEQLLSADELDELQGMADAVQVPLGNILAHHFAASTVLGQNAIHRLNRTLHQLQIAAPLPKPLASLLNCELFLRTPTHGIQHAAAMPVGTSYVLGGVNACGISITATAGPQCQSVRGSVPVSTVSRSVLSQATSIESAVEIIRQLTDLVPFQAILGDGRENRLVNLNFASDSLTVKRGTPSDLFGRLAEDNLTHDNELVLSIDAGAKRISLKRPGAGHSTHSSYDYSKMLGQAQQARTPERPRRHHSALAQPEVTARFELQMRDAPLAADVSRSPTWTGSAIILGSDAISEELAKRLATDGAKVFHLDMRSPLEALVDQVDEISQQGPLHHLFITKDWQRVASLVKEDSLWSAELYHQVEKAFFVCQRFISIADEANRLAQCTVVLCTGLGGDFGFSRGASDPASGALAGLMKAIFFEFVALRKSTGPCIKIIDSDVTETPCNTVSQLFTELASGNLDCEVSWRGHRRQTPFALERTVMPSTENSAPSGVWIATGGARGITAACALELGKRYKLKLHLMGATPLETRDPSWRNLSEDALQKLRVSTMIAARQAGRSALGAWKRLQKKIEIDRTLQDFAAAGVSATYHACDVSDHDALAQVLAHIRQQDGPITGVLHGAGYEKSCRFAKKQRTDVRQTIAAKVAGAANLATLTRRDPLKHFISFGSLAGRWGSPGQADYCLANDWVCKLMGGLRRQRPWIKFTGFHWHPWSEVGMASRPETQSILEGKSNLKLLPLAEGIGHLIREIEAGLPQTEVVITERQVWQRLADGPGRLLEHQEKHTLVASRTNNPSAASESQTANQRNVPRTNEEAAESEDVAFKTTRCEFKLLSAPLPVVSINTPVFDTPVWIYGDNALAQALHERLETGGVEVYRFNNVDNLDFALKQLESLHPNLASKYLFLLSGSDPIPSSCLSASEIERRRHRGIIAPYFIAQHWYQRLLKQPPSGMASLTATVSLGGAFGFTGDVRLPEGGGICGMLKSLHIEDTRRQTRRVRCKVIDFDAADSPQNMLDSLLKELGGDQPEVEVSWAKRQRRVVRPAPTPLVSASLPNMPRNGVWIVTGGARGITSISARELAKRYGWKLHLLGQSPAPAKDAVWRAYNEQELKTLKRQMMRQAIAEGKAPGEAWDRVLKDREIFANLNRFADEGIEATYHSCDVTSRIELARLLDEIRRSGDSINGILYGAGTAGVGRFEHRRRRDVEKMIRTKFDGLLHLLALTQDDPITHCIGFGSISGRFGGNGFSDYAAGNDAMAKVIAWLRSHRPECMALCIHWESWESAGMATLPRYAWGPKSVMHMKYMLPEEGVRRLEQELAAGSDKAEVLYTFGDFYPLLYPDEQQVPGRPNATLDPRPETPEFPLVISTQADAGGFTAHVAFDPVLDPFLAEHRLRGKALLPTVVMLEALYEAATAATGQKVLGYHKIEMLEGLIFHNEEPATVQVRIAQTSGAILDCCLTHDFRNRSGDLIQKERLYLRAKVEVTREAPAVIVALPDMPTQWHDIEYPNDRPIFHGGPFRCLKAIECDVLGGWGKLSTLSLEDFAGQTRAGQWQVPSNVLDSAFYACGCHLWLNSDKAVALPRLIDRLTLGRMPYTGESCYVSFQCQGITETAASYDFTLVGDNGELIAQATGYHTVILTSGKPEINTKKRVSRTHS